MTVRWESLLLRSRVFSITDILAFSFKYLQGYSTYYQLQWAIEWLTDNGSCYTATETRGFSKLQGLKPITTPVKSAQINGMAESFWRRWKGAMPNWPINLIQGQKRRNCRVDSMTTILTAPSAVGHLPPTVFRGKIHNLNILAVLDYRVKTRAHWWTLKYQRVRRTLAWLHNHARVNATRP